MQELAQHAVSIGQRLQDGLAARLKAPPLPPQADPYGSHSLESRGVTKVFACAALTYLHVVLLGAYPELPEIRESVLRTIEAFRELSDARKVSNLVWPFCIAGCMALTQNEDDFRDIASSAGSDGKGSRNLEKAVAIERSVGRPVAVKNNA
jgi:Fungal specific transcription factor domain